MTGFEAGVPVESVYRPGLAHGLDEAGITLGALTVQRRLAGLEGRHA